MTLHIQSMQTCFTTRKWTCDGVQIACSCHMQWNHYIYVKCQVPLEVLGKLCNLRDVFVTLLQHSAWADQRHRYAKILAPWIFTVPVLVPLCPTKNHKNKATGNFLFLVWRLHVSICQAYLAYINECNNIQHATTVFTQLHFVVSSSKFPHFCGLVTQVSAFCGLVLNRTV